MCGQFGLFLRGIARRLARWRHGQRRYIEGTA
jgi:hypothetical protein